jgi:hypothetical protein
VALLGTDGAERQGACGHALLRLEGRIAHPRRAYRVSADHLGKLVHLMGTRVHAESPVAEEPDGAAAEPLDLEERPDIAQAAVEARAEGAVKETGAPADGVLRIEQPRMWCRLATSAPQSKE